MSEKEYIEREALLQKLNENNIPYNADINYFIQNAPTADVQEVRHGEWIISSDGYYPYCSECKSEPKSLSKYCPECGAKMDKE